MSIRGFHRMPPHDELPPAARLTGFLMPPSVDEWRRSRR
jgi:hypothetical protein